MLRPSSSPSRTAGAALLLSLAIPAALACSGCSKAPPPDLTPAQKAAQIDANIDAVKNNKDITEDQRAQMIAGLQKQKANPDADNSVPASP